MDVINGSGFKEIEALLAQSMKGIHHLFDSVKINKILQTPTENNRLYDDTNIERVQSLFSNLVKAESIDLKYSYLSTLSEKDYEILVRTYFQILEDTILASSAYLH